MCHYWYQERRVQDSWLIYFLKIRGFYRRRFGDFMEEINELGIN